METKVCLPKNSGDVKSLKQSDTGNAVCACADLSEITGVCLYNRGICGKWNEYCTCI